MSKIGKLEQKAIDIAKSQVIETATHKYCPSIYTNPGDGKFYVAKVMKDGAVYECAVVCINAVSEVIPKWANDGYCGETAMMDADRELAMHAREGNWPCAHNGFDLYDQLLAEKGLPAQNKNAVAVVEKGKVATMANLQTVATHINEKYERFQTVEKEATMLMLEIGLSFEYAKSQLPHGQLIPWIKNNLTISQRHAYRFRELAQVFIKANSIKEDEMFLLCDPANSQEALGDKLRQMAFDFLGDKTQAELFEQYKIKYQEPKKLTYHPPKGGDGELPEGETREHFVSKATWDEIAGMLNTHGLGTESWANLNDAERQSLYDIVHELDRRLKASLKK